MSNNQWSQGAPGEQNAAPEQFPAPQSQPTPEPRQGWTQQPTPEPQQAMAQSEAQQQPWATQHDEHTMQQGVDWGHPQQQQANPSSHQHPPYGGAASQWQQPQQQAPKEPNALSNVFDLSFNKLALPNASGTIFVIVSVLVLLHWLISVIFVLTQEYMAASQVFDVIAGKLGWCIVVILLLRVFLEGMSSLVKLSNKLDEDSKS